MAQYCFMCHEDEAELTFVVACAEHKHLIKLNYLIFQLTWETAKLKLNLNQGEE
jgi:hypothetical protein